MVPEQDIQIDSNRLCNDNFAAVLSNTLDT